MGVGCQQPAHTQLGFIYSKAMICQQTCQLVGIIGEHHAASEAVDSYGQCIPNPGMGVRP